MKKRNVLNVIIVLLGFIISSCTPTCMDCECDDCGDNGNGNLEIIRDWSNLWIENQKTEEISIYLYHSTSPTWNRTTYTDTSYYSVPSGDYQAIAISKTNQTLLKGMDNYHTATISLPTQFKDSVLTVDNAPLNLADKTTVSIKTEEMNQCVVSPTPLVKVVNFKIFINANENIKEITECRGKLSGVLTSTKIYVEQKTWQSAMLNFDATKNSREYFEKTITMLGVDPTKTKRLNLTFKDLDGVAKSVDLDLSNQLDFSQTAIINCTLEIDITGVGIQVEIVDWQEGTIGDIIL